MGSILTQENDLILFSCPGRQSMLLSEEKLVKTANSSKELNIYNPPLLVSMTIFTSIIYFNK